MKKFYEKLVSQDKKFALGSINLEEHAPKYLTWLNEKLEKSLNVDEAKEKLNKLAIDNAFAIINRETKHLVGITSFYNVSQMNRKSFNFCGS